MAFAMRINFVDVVCEDSLKTCYANGKRTGFQFDIRLSYYRGQFLSVIDTFGVKVDGREISEEAIRFCVNGKEFGISQLHDQVSEFWNIIESATIKIFQPGGLTEGGHEIGVTLMFHSPYMPISDTQYMPIDGCGKKVLRLLT
ncbi:C-glycoside deglycosidase beta subunit domain-containing protein [Anaerosacchariphilus polymeriproducens]|uniref:C-deglycosylation enzyme beta subunit n=1 Tax=Anaerosacchariphilus polymeriproducens TaxID=1812858 RepID=A0A371AYP9_9FIRM|nr:DUF6379 domain-containing protein [Anaerosacchariphilus polymeriproducens]RDU24622.1 hypothetical protein DWV06_03925 [Anaerosacchariphilus polymeriproducens]